MSRGRWTGTVVAALVATSGVLAGSLARDAAPARAGEVQLHSTQASLVGGPANAELLASRRLQLSRGGGWRELQLQDRQLRAAARSQARIEREQRARERERREAERARHEAAQQARQWSRPLSEYRITATFGQSSSLWSSVHTGVDLAAASGVPVGAVALGTVTQAGYDGAYGYKVVVRHEDGTETWYAHLSSISVSVGQTVSSGAVVGLVGATGNVTGPHLHLEVRPGGGEPVDPLPALADRGIDL